MDTIKKFARFYLLSIDTVIRLVGTYLITGLMIAALGVVLNSLNWLFFGSFSTGPLHVWVGLIVLPPLLRLGILAGGFSIPPLLNPSKRQPSSKDKKANKTLHPTAGNAPV